MYAATSVATVFVLTICGYQVRLACGFEAPPPRTLAAEKLHPLGNSGIWLCEDERQLRQDLASLPALRQTIEGLQKGLTVIVMANTKRWATRNPAADVSNAVTAAKSKSGPPDNAARHGVAELMVDPAKIGDVPAVRRHVIRLTNVRIQLALTLSRIRRTSSNMVTTYDRLANDQAVQAALAEMGANQCLGPASEYDLELQRLRDYFPFAETSWVPAYLQGQHLRFTGICNEHAPATFTWTSDLTHVLMTTGSFQAAGLQLSKSAKPIRFQTMGSTMNVYRVRLPYLQFGSCMLREVPAYLLPPEYEYLGNRIGRRSFEGCLVKPDPVRLRVSFGSEE
ncbi:MAG: retropepsin-like aspartic protease [Pirellulaceae bacterium]|nr:retropepsin-like aspartic protease [Pirellulaceae bacterium]MDP6720617.1 retropepsin-like aspartic protease [Pirellulaceae bacterium]